MIVGYTSGVFDLLHQGHINYLKSCKENCQKLVVGVDINLLVKTRKGHDRPRDSLEKRCENVINTGFADLVFIKSKGLVDNLRIINPSVYFKPNNRSLEQYKEEYLEANNIKLISIPYTLGLSTSIIIHNNDKKA